MHSDRIIIFLPAWLSTAIFILALSPIGAFAQSSPDTSRSLQDVQLWLETRGDSAEGIDSLYTILKGVLQQGPPRAILANPFLTMAADLTTVQPVLQDTLDSMPRWQIESTPVKSLLDFWTDFYFPYECALPPLEMPDSLDAAVAQIESTAEVVIKTFLNTLTPEQAKFVRDHHSQLANFLQLYPYGGGFNEETTDALVNYLDIIANADLAAMFCAGLQWSRFLDNSWRNNLQALLVSNPRASEGIIARYFTPYGQIFFGGASGYNLLASNVLLIADIGGDDVYALRTRDAWSGLPQLIMDFAGNDIYEALEPGGYASGIGSISLLTDYAGDDTYHAHSQTQGFGMFGIGILHDLNGNDEYIATAMAQGFAFFGAGLLLDEAGNDRYQVDGMGQGAGMTEGLGILSDLDGTDSYLAKGVVPTSYGTPGLSDSWSQGIGVGVRYITPGGVGFLDDRAGNDNYNAGSFAQGGGYYFGIGLFHDSSDSNDSYLGSRYNFGWGAHMGIGYFREDGGDEHYRTRQIVAAGLAWDLSIALFEDRSGDDVYDMGDFSLGASAHRSISLFHDFGGNDNYRNVQPARANQGPPNLSMFLDTGPGENIFDPPVGDSICNRNSILGFLIVMEPLRLEELSKCKAE